MSEQVTGKTWALVWVIVFASIGCFLWMVYDGAMGNLDQRYFHLDVPGTMELPHLSAGHYFVYHEFDKSRDSKEDLKPAGFGRLAVAITPVAGGAPLAMKAVDKPSRFVIRRDVCESVFEFDVAQAGGYRVNVDYESGQTGGNYRVAIGRPYYTQAVNSFVLGTGMLIVAGIVISYLLYRDGVFSGGGPTPVEATEADAAHG